MDDRLRLLDRWLARRQDLDTLLGPLLMHGPMAVERVGARLAVLRQAREAERLAFEAFSAVSELADAERAGGPVPVDELAAARRRAAAARAAGRDAVHPDLAVLHQDGAPCADPLPWVDVRSPVDRRTAPAGPPTDLD